MVALQRASDVLGAQGQMQACPPLLCGLRPSLDHPTLPLHRVIAELRRLGEAWGGFWAQEDLTGVALGLGA